MAESFIEKIYLGSLDKGALRFMEKRRRDDRVNNLVDRYAAMLGRFQVDSIEREERIPPEMLDQMKSIGLFGVSIPTTYGGMGLDVREQMKLVEEMTKLDISLALTSIAHCAIGVMAILLFGSEDQKRRYLPAAAAGKMIFSYALTEPRIGSDARHIETRADLSEDGSAYILNGHKSFITNANYAGGLTVFAQMDPVRPGYMGAFIVETGWDGVRTGRDMPKMGLKASSTASVQFKNVRVPVTHLLGPPGAGFHIAMTVLNYGRLALGAASVGMMKRSLEDMLKRSSSRIQFQVPIKEFPLVQEKMVKAGVYSRIGAAMNELTAGLLMDNPFVPAAIETSHCKLFGTTRAWEAVYDALQVAGGSGYLTTQPYEKRMRDFRVTTVFEGTTEIHSIYPALTAAKKISEELSGSGTTLTSRVARALRLFFGRIDWPLRFEEKGMREASRLALANAKSIRRMLLLGLLFYRKDMAGKEFLLRRITHLSLYMFGLLSMLAKMEADRHTTGVSEEDLNVLAYFVEEAREVRKVSRSLFGGRKETLAAVIFKDIDASGKESHGSVL